jgi:hypothetical protein
VGSRNTGAVSVGPNPFVPGKTSIKTKLGEKTYNFYENVIKNSGNGGGGNDRTGVLIAVDSPKPLLDPSGKPARDKEGDKLKPYGKVVIYDAVGNVVKTATLMWTKNGSTYGYVWDGKNEKGRYVGPGTYLVRVSGKDENDTKLFVQRKIGVTVEGKNR